MSDSSFDIYSEINYQEVVNAINQANKEWMLRFDLKDSKSEINFNQKEHKVIVISKDKYSLKSIDEILKSKFVKRGISLKGLVINEIKEFAGGKASEEINFQQGIPKEKAKEIVKDIKNIKVKVQTQIMEDKIRVTGKNKDDLQEVIKMIRAKDYQINIEFGNYK